MRSLATYAAVVPEATRLHLRKRERFKGVRITAHVNFMEDLMSTLLIIVLLIVLLGGGGFGYSRWGYGGASGVLGLILVVLLVMWLLGAVGHA
jgi:hypothetical protein